MFSLSVIALVAEVLSRRKFELTTLENVNTHVSPLQKSLSRIELPSVLFFLGILMTVAALESLGIVFNLGNSVQKAIPINIFVILLGAGSAIIDNVPLRVFSSVNPELFSHTLQLFII